MKETYTAYSIDNDPHDQPTPKLVWGKSIRKLDLKINDEVFSMHTGDNFLIKEIIDDDNIILSNPKNPSKDKRVAKISPLYVKMGEIPKEQQSYFYHDQDVEGKTKGDVFTPNPEFLINYREQFKKYFDLIRKTLYNERQDYGLTRLYDSIIEGFGDGIFNAYIRHNFVGQKNNDDTFYSTYEYGFESFRNDRSGLNFKYLMFTRALDIDVNQLFNNGVKAIVYGEGVKIDFTKF